MELVTLQFFSVLLSVTFLGHTCSPREYAQCERPSFAPMQLTDITGRTVMAAVLVISTMGRTDDRCKDAAVDGTGCRSRPPPP